MQGSLQHQPQIKILPAFDIDRRLKLRETDLNEITNMVRELLPQNVNWDIDITITLLEKNLKIMADMALMQEGLTHLIKNTMDGLPVGGNFALNTNRVSCEVESLLDGFNSIVGSCAFIYLADAGAGIDEKIEARVCETSFTLTTDSGKSLGLPITYRIIKGANRCTKGGNLRGQGEANIYLPLTKQEILNMMTIPLGVSCGR
jgi:nitrogen fixation/metabolism regulation signal transduction histidine kinase